MQNHTQSQQPAPSISNPQHAADETALLAISVIAILAIVPIAGVKAYQHYQGVVRQQRIRALERAWRLSPRQKKL